MSRARPEAANTLRKSLTCVSLRGPRDRKKKRCVPSVVAAGPIAAYRLVVEFHIVDGEIGRAHGSAAVTSGGGRDSERPLHAVELRWVEREGGIPVRWGTGAMERHRDRHRRRRDLSGRQLC